tara:strand:- start:162 stop:749 length:588 start_codon:yes stop_codon:yes gene_type:complete
MPPPLLSECIDGFNMSLIGLRNFVIWQCGLRQRNFRKFSGKPSEGTVAAVYGKNSNDEITNLRSVLIEKEPLNSAKMFEFMIKKTHDPEERFLKAVKYFASEYFEDSKIFDGSFSATFPNNSKIVKDLIKKKRLNVQFFESTTGFSFNVNVKKLKKSDPIWKFTFYHNYFFNSSLEENIEILFFKPDKVSFKKIY